MKRKVFAVFAVILVLAFLTAGVSASNTDFGKITFVSEPGIPYESLLDGATGTAVEVAVTPGAWYPAFGGAKWIYREFPVTGGRGETGDEVKFTQEFDLGRDGLVKVNLIMAFSVDNEARIYWNGNLVYSTRWVELNEDTCPRYKDDREYLTLKEIAADVTTESHMGVNTLEVVVLNLPCYEDATNPGGVFWRGNVNWEFIIPIEVAIDIKPGSYPNSFNVDGNGVVPVAILGSEVFDVTLIDPATVNFAGQEVRVKGNGPKCHVEDVNLDGYQDLVCQFEDSGEWVVGTGYADLEGYLYDGTRFYGSDEINIVP